MADTFQLRLVTPTGVVFEGPVVEVTAHGPLGEFAVLAQHINFITSLVPGLLRADLESGGAETWVVSGGLVEVKDGAMIVLANSAETPASLDGGAAQADETSAESKLAALSYYDEGYAAAQDALMLARARKEAASLKSSAGR